MKILLIFFGICIAEAQAESIWLSSDDLLSKTPHIAMIAREPEITANSRKIFQLQTPDAPPHKIKFEFSVTKAGSYKIWAATTPLLSQWCSPYIVALDDKVITTGKALKQQGPAYGDPANPAMFQWYCLAEVDLITGAHSLEFNIDTPREHAESDGKHAYTFYLDSILITSDDVVPSGPKAKSTLNTP